MRSNGSALGLRGMGWRRGRHKIEDSLTTAVDTSKVYHDLRVPRGECRHMFSSHPAVRSVDSKGAWRSHCPRSTSATSVAKNHWRRFVVTKGSARSTIVLVAAEMAKGLDDDRASSLEAGGHGNGV